MVEPCLGLTEPASFGGGIAPNRLRRRTGQPPMRLAGRSPAAAKAGDQVVAHYIGHLTDGTEFDSSHARADAKQVDQAGLWLHVCLRQSARAVRHVRGCAKIVVEYFPLGYDAACP